MPSDFELAFPRRDDRDLVKHPLYQVVDWQTGHLLTYSTIELTLGIDGYQRLADDAALGRLVRQWRARSAQLSALLDAEAVLDALGGNSS
jgi:hypothetical protein